MTDVLKTAARVIEKLDENPFSILYLTPPTHPGGYNRSFYRNGVIVGKKDTFLSRQSSGQKAESEEAVLSEIDITISTHSNVCLSVNGSNESTLAPFPIQLDIVTLGADVGLIKRTRSECVLAYSVLE